MTILVFPDYRRYFHAYHWCRQQFGNELEHCWVGCCTNTEHRIGFMDPTLATLCALRWL